MLVTLDQIIGMAEEKNYCIPAFNVYNMETVMGIIAAAEEAHAQDNQKRITRPSQHTRTGCFFLSALFMLPAFIREQSVKK